MVDGCGGEDIEEIARGKIVDWCVKERKFERGGNLWRRERVGGGGQPNFKIYQISFYEKVSEYPHK